MNYTDADDLDGMAVMTDEGEMRKVSVLTLIANADGMSEEERKKLGNELYRAAVTRAKIKTQLDDEEIQTKIKIADTAIWILDHWKIFATLGAFLIFLLLWVGISIGRTVP
jgi:hypothetical protein